MKYYQFVKVKTQFIAFHCWPDAPEECAYLRDKHRHVFYVEMMVQTTEDRQIEFIALRQKLDSYLRFNFVGQDLGSKSCEKIAEHLMHHFGAESVGVYEDNENGAVLVRNHSTTGD